MERTGSQRLGVCKEVMQGSWSHQEAGTQERAGMNSCPRAVPQTQVVLETKMGSPTPRSLSFSSGSAYTLLVKAGPGRCGWGHSLYLG